MSIDEIKDFISESCYKQTEISEKSVIMQWNTWLKKKKNYCRLLTHLRNGKEYCQSFIIKKNRKSAKQLEIITYQPKAF